MRDRHKVLVAGIGAVLAVPVAGTATSEPARHLLISLSSLVLGGLIHKHQDTILDHLRRVYQTSLRLFWDPKSLLSDFKYYIKPEYIEISRPISVPPAPLEPLPATEEVKMAKPLTESKKSRILGTLLTSTDKTSAQIARKERVSVQQVAALRAHLTMKTYTASQLRSFRSSSTSN